MIERVLKVICGNEISIFPFLARFFSWNWKREGGYLWGSIYIVCRLKVGSVGAVILEQGKYVAWCFEIVVVNACPWRWWRGRDGPAWEGPKGAQTATPLKFEA